LPWASDCTSTNHACAVNSRS